MRRDWHQMGQTSTHTWRVSGQFATIRAPRTIRDFLVNSRLSFWTIRDFVLDDSRLCSGRFVTFTLVNSWLFLKRHSRKKSFSCGFYLNENKRNKDFRFEIWFFLSQFIFANAIAFVYDYILNVSCFHLHVKYEIKISGKLH